MNWAKVINNIHPRKLSNYNPRNNCCMLLQIIVKALLKTTLHKSNIRNEKYKINTTNQSIQLLQLTNKICKKFFFQQNKWYCPIGRIPPYILRLIPPCILNFLRLRLQSLSKPPPKTLSSFSISNLFSPKVMYLMGLDYDALF